MIGGHSCPPIYFMISDKIALLNQTVLESFNETDERKIIEAFSEVGIKVLEADHAFVWLNSYASQHLELVYTSKNLPFKPRTPREKGRNYKAYLSGKADFVSDVSKVEDASYLNKYIKSFVIIPICFREKIYGNIVFCFKNKEPFLDEKKSLCSFIGNSLAQAITIRRLFAGEQEARALSERHKAYFQALIENSYEIEMLVDKNGIILYSSPSVKNFFGLTVKQIINHNIKEFINNNDSQSVTKYLKKILENPGENHVREFSYKNRDGIIRTLESTGYNMLDNFNVSGIVINMRDITSRKRLESEKESRRLLYEEKKKIEFIAEANHELRTPLAIIKGNVDLILREAGPKRKRRYADAALRQINAEVKHLTNILSDFSLLTTRIEESPYRIIKKNVALDKIIKRVVNRCKIIARKKKISIRKKLAETNIFGDAKYLDRLVMNLIKNAITYGTEKGWILVEMSKNDDQIVLKVSDNGVGIGENDLPYIFERFYRADKSHSAEEKRTGLGLAISKWIVEAHGGKIAVDSTLGKGTIFTVSLPTKGLETV